MKLTDEMYEFSHLVDYVQEKRKKDIRKLFMDKTIKYSEKCDNCGIHINPAKYKRNKGLCNDCINEIN